jgi:hypothetical protein
LTEAPLEKFRLSANVATGEANVATKTKPPKAAGAIKFKTLPDPTLWPGANARLLSAGAGLPVQPLDRLANFDDTEFERFTLEWAHDYLAKNIPAVDQIQQRGGAGDKGRDIVVWLDPSSVTPRRWHLYQCKHYAAKLSASDATSEIGKVLYNTLTGTYTAPEEYWFVTHKGVTGPLQDLLDNPTKLKSHVLANWAKDCEKQITFTEAIPLSAELAAHIAQFDFSIFHAKQPLEMIEEHAKTKYHMLVFGAPLVKRPPPPQPPSSVVAEETVYVSQLFAVIAEALGVTVHRLLPTSKDRSLQKMMRWIRPSKTTSGLV